MPGTTSEENPLLRLQRPHGSPIAILGGGLAVLLGGDLKLLEAALQTPFLQLHRADPSLASLPGVRTVVFPLDPVELIQRADLRRWLHREVCQVRWAVDERVEVLVLGPLPHTPNPLHAPILAFGYAAALRAVNFLKEDYRIKTVRGRFGHPGTSSRRDVSPVKDDSGSPGWSGRPSAEF